MKNSNVADRQQCFSVEEAEELTGGIKKWQISTWGSRLEEPEKYREMLFGAAYYKAMAEKNRTATKWTGDPESYTPTKYIEAAREVMGGIDLDPASNMHAQKTVKATEWYDEHGARLVLRANFKSSGLISRSRRWRSIDRSCAGRLRRRGPRSRASSQTASAEARAARNIPADSIHYGALRAPVLDGAVQHTPNRVLHILTHKRADLTFQPDGSKIVGNILRLAITIVE
ncbi:MAG: hypothetical protein O7D31_11990 [Alphaproteobacteria bacterium]|nr:hypothetical protein [Alphaproteobacteria bacterium]